jgi:hypothetical protein
MSYCPGRICSKRDQCQKHYNSGQVIDWSTYGHGHAGTDKDGYNLCHIEIYCGDDGTYGYTRFEQHHPVEDIKTNF